MKKRLQTIIAFLLIIGNYASAQPEKVVKDFGEAMSSWCSTNNILYREKIDALCSGPKSCRVEDKIHADYQKKRGLTNYETFVLDSYMNMFQTLRAQNIQFQMSNVKLGATDMMPDGELSFVTADIKVSGPVNYMVTDLFLVREGKITGIYSYSSQLGFSHLNGSLIRALKIGRYVQTSGFKNGYAVVTNEGNHDGLIDVKGSVIIPCIWDNLDYCGGEFAQGRNYKSNYNYCVYDLRFNAKRTPLYGVQDYLVGTDDEPPHFMNGMATVYLPGRHYYGFLREDDLTYNDIKYDYKRVNRFSDDRATVVTEDAVLVIDKEYNVKWRESERYSSIGAYNEGLCPIKDNFTELWGFMDKEGKIIIDCKFYNVDRFSEGYACVEVYDKKLKCLKTGVINKKGDFVIPPRFDGKWKNYYFKDGYIPLFKYINIQVNVNGEIIKRRVRRASLIEIGGQPIEGLGWQYDDIGFFYDGMARCEKDDKYGFISRKGKLIVSLEYDDAYAFSNGYAVVGKEIDGKMKYGYINTDGILIVPLIYDDVSNFENGIALIKQGEKIGLIDVYGNSSFF